MYGDTAADLQVVQDEVSRLQEESITIQTDITDQERALAVLQPLLKQTDRLAVAEERLAELTTQEAKVAADAERLSQEALERLETQRATLTTRSKSLEAKAAVLTEEGNTASQAVLEGSGAHDQSVGGRRGAASSPGLSGTP